VFQDEAGAFSVEPFVRVARISRKGVARQGQDTKHSDREVDADGDASGSETAAGIGNGDSGTAASDKSDSEEDCRLSSEELLAVLLFDCIKIGDEDLLHVPLGVRRRRLRELLQPVAGDEFPQVRLVPSFDWQVAPVSDTEAEVADVPGAAVLGDADASVRCVSCGSELEEALRSEVLRAAAYGCEGVMLKALDGATAAYAPARQNPVVLHPWLKLKVDASGLSGAGTKSRASSLTIGGDTLDLAVVAAYKGKGKRGQGYGSFLLACTASTPESGSDRDGQTLVPVARIGTGLTDEALAAATQEINSRLGADEAKCGDPPEWLQVHSAMLRKSTRPDVWLREFESLPIWEIKATELTASPMYRAGLGRQGIPADKGVSLRFPRLVRQRQDKDMTMLTTEEDVAAMYRR
jgi:ATP-dependent DNA ligase